MSPRAKTVLAAMLTSPRMQKARRSWHETRRRLTGNRHRLVFYHRVDDAWSWLLAQALQRLAREYDVDVQIRLLASVSVDHVRDPAQLDRYAAYDAGRLARAWGLEFTDRGAVPDHRLSHLAARVILANPGLETLLEATAAAWRADETGLAGLARERGAVRERLARQLLAENHASLVRGGHYLGAMIWYAGEWYWGLDRLGFLERRLRDLDLGGSAGLLTDRMFAALPRERAGSPLAQTLEFYFSFRSPYSYLAAEQVGVFADRLGLDLQLRPLLPMVNRGIAVPRSKLRYIVTDAARVACAQGIAFGPLRDPLGPAVERCLALAIEAQHVGPAREFMLAAMRAIWTRAADPGTNRVLAGIAAEAGLSSADVSRALASNRWRARVEANAAALAVLGLWGVPCLCLRGADERPVAVAWGQDRFWAIERAAIGLDMALAPPGLVGRV